MQPRQGSLKVFHQQRKRTLDSLDAANQHVVYPRQRARRQHVIGRGTQPATGAITLHRIADLAADGNPKPGRRLVRGHAVTVVPPPHLQHQAVGGPHVAVARDPQIFRPTL